MSKKSEIIYQISDILDNCETCPIKRSMLDAGPYNASVHSKIQRYCNKQCLQGKQLQSLGRDLGRSDEPRGDIPDEETTTRRMDKLLERVRGEAVQLSDGC